MPNPDEEMNAGSSKVENTAALGLKLDPHTMSALQQPMNEETYSENDDIDDQMDEVETYKEQNVTIEHFEDEQPVFEVQNSKEDPLGNIMEGGGAVQFEETEEPMDVEGSDHSSQEFFTQTPTTMDKNTVITTTEEHNAEFLQEDVEEEDEEDMGTVEYLHDQSSEEAETSAEGIEEGAVVSQPVKALPPKGVITKDGTVVQLKPNMHFKKLVDSAGAKPVVKRPLLPGPGQSKMTKVIIQGGPHSQPFKLIGPGGQPRAITLAQAQQMGLKLQQILPGVAAGQGQKRMVVKKIIAPSGSSLLSTVSGVKSPTKILPAPSPLKLGTIRPTVTTLRGPVSVANLQSVKGMSTIKTISGSPMRTVPVSALTAMRQSGLVKTVGGPQKMIIRQGGLPLKSGAIISHGSGQVIRIPPQPIQMAGGKQVQYVRLVSTSGNTLPTTTLINSAKTKIIKGPIPQGAFKAVPIAPGPGPTVKTVLPKPAPGKRIFIPVSQGIQQICISNEFPPTIAEEDAVAESAKTVQSPPAASPKEGSEPPEGSFIVSDGSLIMVAPEAPEEDAEPGEVEELEDEDEEEERDKEDKEEPMDEENFDKENIDSDGRCSTSPGRLLEANGIRLKKPCNCTRSQCLKLYCECFANGEFCFQCNCNNCYNNINHEEERQKSIRACLERNPTAFKPKIHQGENEEDERRHNKGCNCKRSGCLKNYCECYEAKITCSRHCKCLACRNTEEFLEKSRSGLLELADVAEENFMMEQKGDVTVRSQFNPLKQPYNFMSSEVVEATCQCLLAQAEEAERSGLAMEEGERLIIEEFGRCLVQIIGFSKEDDNGSRS